jgi:hypothetical protein
MCLVFFISLADNLRYVPFIIFGMFKAWSVIINWIRLMNSANGDAPRHSERLPRRYTQSFDKCGDGWYDWSPLTRATVVATVQHQLRLLEVNLTCLSCQSAPAYQLLWLKQRRVTVNKETEVVVIYFNLYAPTSTYVFRITARLIFENVNATEDYKIG